MRALLKGGVNQRPSPQSLVCPASGPFSDLERAHVLRMTVIPTTRTIQQRGDTQDTVVTAADGRTFLVRQHINTALAVCPLGRFTVRRLAAVARP